MIGYIARETGFSYRNIVYLLIASLLIHFVAAWHSLGFFHYDEHYQILEFAGLKAGLTTEKDLAWEYREQIRPTLQPWIAYGVIKAFSAIAQYDSFTVAGILRFITAIFGWFTSILLCRATLPMISGRNSKKLLFLLSFFLWFIVFIDVRFSSESWGGLCFYTGLAIVLIYNLFQKSLLTKANIFYLLLSGFFMGLSIVFRFQMALMLPGLGLWCIFVARTPFKHMALLAFGALTAIAIGFVSDYIFYGNWVNTAYNYFDVNINQDKAAQFGVEPWWYYVPEFLHKAFLPLSYVIATLIVIAWIRRPRNIYTCTALPFIVLHMLISHKELRFLFPIAHAMPFFLAVGIQYVAHNFHIWKQKKILKWGFIFLCAVLILQNTILLAEKSLKPVNGILLPYKHAYRKALNTTYTIDVLIPYHYDYDLLTGLPTNFYVPGNINIYKYTSPADVERHIKLSNNPVMLLLSNRGPALPPEYKNIATEIESVQYTMPGWLMKININNWVDRTSQWRIYYFNSDVIN